MTSIEVEQFSASLRSQVWVSILTSGTLPRRLGVAVSGGSDSMALLDLSIRNGQQYGFEVHAVTVDHGLRAEAKDEIALVFEFCASRNTPHDVLTWNWDGKGNLQGRARKARYAMIGDWALRKGIDLVALGHTRSDQAETVLMRLARQSGVDGLAGMEQHFERDNVRWIRPLLILDRKHLQRYLRLHDLKWCDDPSNEDDTFERVRMRKAAPILAELGITTETLTGISFNMQSAKDALKSYTIKEVQGGLVEENRGDLVMPACPTANFPVPFEILRRVQIYALQWLSGSDYPPRSTSMMNLEIALPQAGKHTLQGCFLTLNKDPTEGEPRLRFSREYNAVKDLNSPTDQLWDGRWAIAGPHSPDLEVRALGEAVKDCADWRESGLPRTSLLSSPAIWRGEELVSAPLAGFSNGWTAKATGRGNFAEFLLSR